VALLVPAWNDKDPALDELLELANAIDPEFPIDEDPVDNNKSPVRSSDEAVPIKLRVKPINSTDPDLAKADIPLADMEIIPFVSLLDNPVESTILPDLPEETLLSPVLM